MRDEGDGKDNKEESWTEDTFLYKCISYQHRLH